VKCNSVGEAKAIIEREHSALSELLQKTPRCPFTRYGDSCDGQICEHREQCDFLLRGLLHHLTNGVSIHFKHEDEVMANFSCSPLNLDRHAAEHQEILLSIQVATARYIGRKNLLGTLIALEDFSTVLLRHASTTDVEMMESLVD
jgi:hemerythrin